jgi:hypothetical protein
MLHSFLSCKYFSFTIIHYLFIHIAKLSERSSSSWAEFSFIVSFSPPTNPPPTPGQVMK